MDPGPVCILTVLSAKGYAEHVRLALTVGGIAFEDRRVGYDEVARMRAAGELPFGQVQTRVALRDPPPKPQHPTPNSRTLSTLGPWVFSWQQLEAVSSKLGVGLMASQPGTPHHYIPSGQEHWALVKAETPRRQLPRMLTNQRVRGFPGNSLSHWVSVFLIKETKSFLVPNHPEVRLPGSKLATVGSHRRRSNAGQLREQ